MFDVDNKTAEVVNHLFRCLVAIKPAFKQAWPTEEEFMNTKKEWIIAFKQENISSLNLIKVGLDKIRISESCFIPSPGEFIALCEPDPEQLGLPSLSQAYKEACETSHPCSGKKCSHEVIRYARNATGSHFLSSESASVTKPVFEDNYKIAIKLFLDGKIMDQLESPKKGVHEYQEYVGKLKSDIMIGFKPKGTQILSFDEWKLVG